MTPSHPISERRASARAPHRVRAVLSTRLGEVAADVLDISEGGLSVEITGELRSCDFVRVLLPLAPGDDTSEWVDPDALVARVHGKTDSGRTRLGLSFFRLPASTLRRIAECVANGLEPALPPPVPTPRVEPSRPAPRATVPPPASTATTRKLPKAASAPTTTRTLVTQPDPPPLAIPKPAPVTAPTPAPLHIPRTSARELRALFHEAVASLEEHADGKKQKSN